MINLPQWKLTLTDPLYDTSSTSPIEMTGQVYAKVREVVEEFNRFSAQMEKTINDHIVKGVDGMQEFEKSITKIMNDYIRSIDSKISVLTENNSVIGYNEPNEELIVGGATNE